MEEKKRIGDYEVYKNGRIYSLKSKIWLKPYKHSSKKHYLKVSLYFGGFRHRINLHQAIWEAFNMKPGNGYCIDHINNNAKDNRIENLQVLSISDNSKKRWENAK